MNHVVELDLQPLILKEHSTEKREGMGNDSALESKRGKKRRYL